MMDEISAYLKQTDPVMLWGSVVGIILLIIGLALIVKHLNQQSDEELIKNTINELGDDHMKDVIISDGMYGYFFADYLISIAGQIIILGIEHYEGYIFGSENIEEWAQVHDKKSSKFNNPLRSYETCAQSLNSLIKDADVKAHIVFTSASSFPKGVPEGVLQMSNFKSSLEELIRTHSANQLTDKCWADLKAVVNQHASEYHQEKLA